eukprot:tig00021332_g20349.t1
MPATSRSIRPPPRPTPVLVLAKPSLVRGQSRATRIADSISGATFQRWTQAASREPLDSKPRTFPARPDVVRANVARAAGDGLLPLTRFIITHCVVDPTTFLVGSETEGWMTSVAGIVEYIARTEGPTPPPPSALTSRTAGWTRPRRFGPGPLSLGESQPALEAIAIPVAQFKDPAPDVGPFLVKPHTKGKGKRTRNSAPAFLPPQPPPRPPSSAPASSASTRCCRARVPDERRRGPERLRELGLLRERRRPQPLPGPGAVLTAIQGFGAQQEAERRALAARQAREAEERRQALWAQRLQATIAFRAELDSGFRAGQIAGAEASERWRAFEAESAGLAKGLGYSYRRVPVLKDYASAAAREASRAEIDAAEEQAAREEAEDNARFRHLHH